MSLFDSASLVVTPNGYKEDKLYSIKPTDGSGDLVVTRATTATRVNSDGLIEEVPYNLVTYSNTFSNSDWIKSDMTFTSGQSDPFGSTNAWRYLTLNASNGYAYQGGVTKNGQMTLSFWVKSNTSSNQTFVMTANSGTQSSPTITANSTWQRVTWSFTSSGTGSNVLIAYNGTSILDLLIYGFQAEQGSSAKEYFPTTDRLDVPRLDYTNSSCPSILVEPQRTNLLLRSQQFSSSSWSSAGTIVDNVAISPDGTQNATEMSESPYVYQGNTFGICTVSCYFKKTTSNTIAIRMDTTEVNYITFNINTGIVADVPSGFTASITSVGNGWYRCTATSTASVGLVLFISPCYIWGAQCEVGSYATSYVPTVASSVTRNADVISNTNSFISGKTEACMFIDFERNYFNSDFNPFISYRNGTTCDFYMLAIPGGSTVEFRARSQNGVENTISYNILLGRNKIALCRENDKLSLFLNGVKVSENTSASPMNEFVNSAQTLRINADPFFTSYEQQLYINSVAIWSTALTDIELAQLTTI